MLAHRFQGKQPYERGDSPTLYMLSVIYRVGESPYETRGHACLRRLHEASQRVREAETPELDRQGGGGGRRGVNASPLAFGLGVSSPSFAPISFRGP